MAVCLVSFASAQITTGEPVSRVIKNGNRPTAGTWGLFVGPSVTEMIDWVDNWSTNDESAYWKGLPLINIKYYSSPKLEFRLGLQFYSKSKSITTGTDEFNSEGDVTQKYVTKNKMSEGESYNRITPGIAYHFSPHNLVDVYVGATIPIGFSTYSVNSSSKSIENGETLTAINNVSKNAFTIGLGAFVGLQFFVADLPLAFGVEYGLTGLAKFGGNYKYKVKGAEDDKAQVYYSETGDGNNYDHLSMKNGTFGSDARITISYFFNGKKK